MMSNNNFNYPNTQQFIKLAEIVRNVVAVVTILSVIVFIFFLGGLFPPVGPYSGGMQFISILTILARGFFVCFLIQGLIVVVSLLDRIERNTRNY